MARRKMTQRQREAYEFIVAFTERNGYAPSGRELAEALGITLRPAQKLINALYIKDYIKKIPYSSRGIVLP